MSYTETVLHMGFHIRSVLPIEGCEGLSGEMYREVITKSI